MTRTLLLVDDEPNILSALTRVFRRQDYRVFRANSGREGLEILGKEDIGVIVSDQRMPQMTGTEFLRQAKTLRPLSVRMVLSGYTDIQSITDAVNEGAIHKFLTKPWDDEQLQTAVEQAFERFELQRSNQELTDDLRRHNEALHEAKQSLERDLKRHATRADVTTRMLQVSHAVLEELPLGVVGVDEDGFIVVANGCARDWLGGDELPIIGQHCAEALSPDLVNLLAAKQAPTTAEIALTNDRHLQARLQRLTVCGTTLGNVIILTPKE